MSYDIAIWSARARDPKLWGSLGALPPAPQLAAFHRALVAIYPELRDDNEDDSPWNAELDVTARYILAPMAYSRAADVPGEVAALAKAHGLVVFDPQTGAFVAPARARRPSTKRDPGAILASQLAKPLARHGFALAPYRVFADMPVFARRDGIATQELTFRTMTSRNADAWLRVQLDPIAAILDPISAGWKRGLFAGGWHGGAIANDPYALDLGLVGPTRAHFGDHDISPDGIATTVRQVSRQLVAYGLPMFAKLRTVKQLDAFLHATAHEVQSRAHVGDCELALVGMIVARLAKRRDLAAWRAAYRPLVNRRSLVPPHQAAARAAFARL